MNHLKIQYLYQHESYVRHQILWIVYEVASGSSIYYVSFEIVERKSVHGVAGKMEMN